MKFFDGFRNLVAGLGSDRDKSTASQFVTSLMTDQQLLDAYRGSWLAQKIIDIPAFDATREWRSWSASSDEIEKIESLEKKFRIRQKVCQALILARLFGGSAIYFGTNDLNVAEPFDINRVQMGGLRYVTVLPKSKISAGSTELDPASEFFNRPSKYTITGLSGISVEVHPSRLVIFKGNELPEEDPRAQMGWGDSVLAPMMETLLRSEGGASNINALLFKASVDVIRIPGLMKNISDTRYEKKVMDRFSLASLLMGTNKVMLLDKEEEYDRHQASFASLADLLDRFDTRVSGAADIPLTRLFGRSPAGMNATGESDLKNYYDHIKSIQTVDLDMAMENLNEALIVSALGTRPPEVFFTWRSLWQMSEKERAEIGKITADTIKVLADGKIFPEETLSQAAANALTEAEVLPGLEAAIEEFGAMRTEEERLAEEAQALAAASLAAPAGAAPAGGGTGLADRSVALADASPRTLYVRRDVLNGEEILAWAREQGFTNTLEASDLHVTIAYSRAPVDWMKMGEPWSSELEIRAGGPRLVDRLGTATVLLVSNSELMWRHEEMKRNGASWDFPEYQPHVSISYDPESPVVDVKPYTGRILLGPEIFEELDPEWKSRAMSGET